MNRIPNTLEYKTKWPLMLYKVSIMEAWSLFKGHAPVIDDVVGIGADELELPGKCLVGGSWSPKGIAANVGQGMFALNCVCGQNGQCSSQGMTCNLSLQSFT